MQTKILSIRKTETGLFAELDFNYSRVNFQIDDNNPLRLKPGDMVELTLKPVNEAEAIDLDDPLPEGATA